MSKEIGSDSGPVVEALRFAGNDPDLRELFANLLVSSMDAERARDAHPSFVEIIKQLTPDEARLLRYLRQNHLGVDSAVPYLDIHVPAPGGHTVVARNISLLGRDAGCDHVELTRFYIDNLCRLELCGRLEGSHIADEGTYDELENDPDIIALADSAAGGATPIFFHRMMYVTNFGRQFVGACVAAD